MMTDHTGRDLISHGELALDEKGKILAIRSQSLFQIGAYFVGPGMVSGAVLAALHPGGLRRADDPHRVQGHLHQHAAGGPLSRRRAPGGGLLHRAADRACGERDRHGRRRNPPRQSDRAGQVSLQHADALHLRLGRVRALLDKCVEMADWKGYGKRKRESEKSGKLRGRSVCYYIEFGGIFNDRMDIRFDPGGTVTVFGGTHSHGQGHATVFAQCVHEWLGVPFEQIRYVQGDTAQVRSGAAPTGRAARWSAAARSSAPPMASSRRQSRSPPP
jgi:carbon-monoxide dehydrogenase large subunit